MGYCLDWGAGGLFQIFVLFHCLGSVQESGTDGCPMEKHIGRQSSWRWCHTEGSLGKHQAECMMNVARREQDGILGERGLCVKTEGEKSINVTWATAGESKGWGGLGLLLMIQMKWMLALHVSLGPKVFELGGDWIIPWGLRSSTYQISLCLWGQGQLHSTLQCASTEVLVVFPFLTRMPPHAGCTPQGGARMKHVPTWGIRSHSVPFSPTPQSILVCKTAW